MKTGEKNLLPTCCGAAIALEEIKTPVEAEIERVVQSVNEWDDRTSPDDYPEHLLITSEELADILRNFAETTLESFQREIEELRKKADARENELVVMLNSADESRVGQIRRAEAAEAEVKRLREALGAVLAAHDIKSVKGKLLVDVIASATERARTALASTGGEHHGN